MTAKNHQRIVYYVGRQEHPNVIKIGTTVCMPKRLVNLRKKYGESLVIFAMENDPVNDVRRLDLEGTRHFEFRKDRIIGEWFWKSPELNEHMESLPQIELVEVDA